MADIVIINPRFEISFWGLEAGLRFLGKRASIPIGALPLLAALTPPEHRVALIDENVEELDFSRCQQADIVGITGMSVQRHRMLEIATELKKRGCYLVIGGPWKRRIILASFLTSSLSARQRRHGPAFC